MATIRVVIPDETDTRLRQIAAREYRMPRQQAAVLLAEAIERASAPTDPRADAEPSTPTAEPDR